MEDSISGELSVLFLVLFYFWRLLDLLSTVSEITMFMDNQELEDMELVGNKFIIDHIRMDLLWIEFWI